MPMAWTLQTMFGSETFCEIIEANNKDIEDELKRLNRRADSSSNNLQSDNRDVGDSEDDGAFDSWTDGSIFREEFSLAWTDRMGHLQKEFPDCSQHILLAMVHFTDGGLAHANTTRSLWPNIFCLLTSGPQNMTRSEMMVLMSANYK